MTPNFQAVLFCMALLDMKPELRVVELDPGAISHDVVVGLRKLADMIESGEVDGTSITCCNGAEIFHYGKGCVAKDACWNLTQGLHYLMYGPSKEMHGDNE